MRSTAFKRRFDCLVIRFMHFHFTNKAIKPSKETEANNDVDGKRNGLIFPFKATNVLKIDKEAVTTVKKTTNSGRFGFSATYAYAPPIKKVKTVVTCQV